MWNTQDSIHTDTLAQPDILRLSVGFVLHCATRIRKGTQIALDFQDRLLEVDLLHLL